MIKEDHTPDIVTVYKDSDVTVCIKPAGVLSQSDLSNEKGLTEILSEQYGKPVYPVHRLDRPVGGLMVFALNKKAAAFLSGELSQGRKNGLPTAKNKDGAPEDVENPVKALFEKEYAAVVSGDCPDEGEMTDYLLKKDGKVYAIKTQRKGAKFAKLSFRVTSKAESEGKTLSLVRVKLFTGRTHQIRVQFASRGMPVAGDGKYGSRLKCENISLYSVKIGFIHPVTKEKMIFTADYPKSGYFKFFVN